MRFEHPSISSARTCMTYPKGRKRMPMLWSAWWLRRCWPSQGQSAIEWIKRIAIAPGDWKRQLIDLAGIASRGAARLAEVLERGSGRGGSATAPLVALAASLRDAVSKVGESIDAVRSDDPRL